MRALGTVVVCLAAIMAGTAGCNSQGSAPGSAAGTGLGSFDTVSAAFHSQARSSNFRVLICAVPECADENFPDLGKLPSAEALRKRLSELGFDPKLLFGPEATSDAVFAWMQASHAAERLLIVCIGHGVERVVNLPEGPQRRQVFLTADATGREGGLEIEALKRLAGEAPYSTLMVLDMCRSEQAVPPAGNDFRPAAAAENIQAARGPKGAMVRAKDDFTGAVAVFNSTQSGRAAFNDKDFTSGLVEALDFDEEKRRFRGQQTPDVMRFLDWFRYASFRVQWNQELKQTPDPWDPRELFLQPFLSSATGGVAPIVGGFQRLSGVNLASVWKPAHGEFSVISRPDEPLRVMGKAGNAFVGGYVAPRTLEPEEEDDERLSGFRTTDRALFLEVVATLASRERRDVAEVSLGVDVKAAYPPAPDVIVNESGSSYEAKLRPYRPTSIRVPLKSGQRLNYVALTHLNEDVTFIVQRMFLDSDTVAVAPLPWNGLISGSWWPDAAGRTQGVLGLEQERIDDRAVVRVRQGTGWIAGRVRPGVWVSAGDIVECELENLSSAPAAVTVSLNESASPSVELVSKRWDVRAGKGVYRFDVRRSGRIDEMTIGVADADFRIHRVEILPQIPEF